MFYLKNLQSVFVNTTSDKNDGLKHVRNKNHT